MEPVESFEVSHWKFDEKTNPSILLPGHVQTAKNSPANLLDIRRNRTQLNIHRYLQEWTGFDNESNFNCKVDLYIGWPRWTADLFLHAALSRHPKHYNRDKSTSVPRKKCRKKWDRHCHGFSSQEPIGRQERRFPQLTFPNNANATKCTKKTFKISLLNQTINFVRRR